MKNILKRTALSIVMIGCTQTYSSVQETPEENRFATAQETLEHFSITGEIKSDIWPLMVNIISDGRFLFTATAGATAILLRNIKNK